QAEDGIRDFHVTGVQTCALPSSPDGRTLAFSGMRNGLGDLFLMDIETGEVRQLTDDRYSNLHPDFSPDGSKLVYSTDEGPDTDFETLVFGHQRLAIIDVQTGQRELLEAFPGVKHINPQYSPDGRSLYFIANPEGFSDIFRMDLQTGELYQITRVAT